MEVWIVFKYYNARTDNSIHGVFGSRDMAIKYVEDYIEKEREYSLQFGVPHSWEEPDATSYGDIEYHTDDYDESFEITSHIVQMKETSSGEEPK